MDKPGISAFFPLFNEEGNVEKLVKSVDGALSRLAGDYEIILVDDGSRDKTSSIARVLSQVYPRIKIVSHKENLGYGAAVRSGLLNCRYDLIFFSDGDNQFDLNELELLLKYIDDADAVLGYRQKRRDPFPRILNSWGWGLLLNLLFNLNLRDINCAFKLFKKSLLDKIGIERLESKGALISAEIMIRLKKADARIIQVPVSHYPRKSGRQTGASFKVILRAFRELAALYSRLK